MSQSEPAIANSPFFRLPGEPWNKIYHHALTIDKPVLVNSKGFDVPPLLVLRHNIRSDAASIFYARNRFDVLFEFYDSARAAKFLYIAREHTRATSREVTMKYLLPIVSTPNWRNLVLWMCRIRYNVLPPADLYGQSSFWRPLNDDDAPQYDFASDWDPPAYLQRIDRKQAILAIEICQCVSELIEATRIHGPVRTGKVPTVLVDDHEQPLGQWLEGVRQHLFMWEYRWRFDYPWDHRWRFHCP